MHRPINPITLMLIQQMHEVKALINEVQEKIAKVDVDEMLEKKPKRPSKR